MLWHSRTKSTINPTAHTELCCATVSTSEFRKIKHGDERKSETQARIENNAGERHTDDDTRSMVGFRIKTNFPRSGRVGELLTIYPNEMLAFPFFFACRRPTVGLQCSTTAKILARPGRRFLRAKISRDRQCFASMETFLASLGKRISSTSALTSTR